MNTNKIQGVSIFITRGVMLLMLLTITGCAEYYKLNREGLTLMEQGRYEAGLKKLSDASAAAPDNANYRADYLRNLEQTVNRLLDQASRDQEAGKLDSAQRLLEQVLKIDPENGRAKLGMDKLAMTQRHAVALASVEEFLKNGNLDDAQIVLKPVLLEDPENDRATLLQRYIQNLIIRSEQASLALQSKFKKPVNMQFRDANLKLVFESLSRTSGINILLDRDVKDTLKTTVFVNDVSVEDTIDIILLQNQLEKRILNENSVFIYPNSPAKLKEYQELVIKSFHLVNADAKQMLVMIKTLLKTKDMFVHEKTNSLVMRDTPEAIRLAEKIIADQDRSDPEVMLEVEVLEVSTSRLQELGIKLPDQITISPIPSSGNTGLTLKDLANLNKSKIAVSPISATLNMQLQDGDVKMLATPRIRVRNHEKAKILIGDRVPVITETTVASGATTTPTTNVNYLDVGLTLEVEPDIHSDRQVGIKINLEVSNITRDILVGNTLAYQVGTRKATTVLRLNDGETQVLAGLISNEDRNSASKIPGLGQLPILGRLFSSERDDGKKTEIILSITPRIVGNLHLQEAGQMEFWSGTEGALSDKSLSLKTVGAESIIATNQLGLGRPLQLSSPSQVPAQARGVEIQSAAKLGEPKLMMTWLGPMQSKKGSTVNLTLNGQAVEALNGLSFVVNYDAGTLKANEVLEGNLLSQGGASASFSKIIDQSKGQIIVNASLPAGQEGVKGSGSIATLSFEVVGDSPQSQITVTQLKAVDAAGKPLEASVPAAHNLRQRP